MTSILIPLHNSAHSLDPSEVARLLFLALRHNGDEDEGTITSDCSAGSSANNTDSVAQVGNKNGSGCHYALNVQCHSEGVFWTGLMPLFTIGGDDSDGWRHAILALAILVGHSEQSSGNPSFMETKPDGTSSHSIAQIDMAKAKLASHHIFNWLVITTSFEFIKKDTMTNNSHLIVALFPPNPTFNNSHYSRTPSTRPTNTFTQRLITYENSQLRLQSVSAYLSTLGGGYFLCHHLSTALLLAKQQCAVAKLRGDQDMIWRCRINMGYCSFYAGKLKRGRKVVRSVLSETLVLLKSGNNDEANPQTASTNNGTETSSLTIMNDRQKTKMCNVSIIRNMCLSALWFADRLEEAKLKEEENGSGTHDDYKRIRVVKDRSAVV